ncbi:MAG: hypothetical protein WCY41_01790 [Candidatus Micrarchaeia archaeon]
MRSAVPASGLFLLLLALQAHLALAQAPYSDAAFSTFISTSVNETNVTVRVTFLNITYFSQYNETAIAEVTKKVTEAGNLDDLHQMGNYSIDNFTAEVDPLNCSALHFTFEGMEIVDGAGEKACDPINTSEQGMASCKITHYKDANGTVHPIDDYKSCGYVTIRADSMVRGSAKFPEASQTAVVCPVSNAGLSAFAPAIYKAISDRNRLPFCFPAMLIAGLLIAAMYYAGRDPLSLFDITTPKLPKAKTFRVRMGQSPQMLRQVKRRYMMIGVKSRRDSVKEIARFARKNGMDAEKAKKEMQNLYDKAEKMMGGKEPLSDADRAMLLRDWNNLMGKYAPVKRKDESNISFKWKMHDYERSLKLSSGLLTIYLDTHAAMKMMEAARSRGGTNILSKKVSKGLDKTTKAVNAFESSKIVNILGYVPFVGHVLTIPGKVLDVGAQFRSSRAAIKGVRNEMLGQMAYRAGHDKNGKPKRIYKMFESLHVKDGKKTKFGKYYEKITGKSWAAFETKHDLLTKRLVTLYNTVNSKAQHETDQLNRMFAALGFNVLSSIPTRSNASRKLAAELRKILPKKEQDKRELDDLARRKGMEYIFEKIKKQLREKVNSKESHELAAALDKLYSGNGMDKNGKNLETADLDRQLKQIVKTIDGLKGLSKTDKDVAKAFATQLRESIGYEQEVARIINDRGMNQQKKLEELLELAKKASKSDKETMEYLTTLGTAIKTFGEVEKGLKEKMLIYLSNEEDAKNIYKIIEKKDVEIEMDSRDKVGKEKRLREKYGDDLVNELFKHRELYASLIDLRSAATSGKGVAGAVEKMKQQMEKAGVALSDADRAALDKLASGAKGGTLSQKELNAARKTLDSLKSLKEAENVTFKAYDDRRKEMKKYLLDGKNAQEIYAKYESITTGIMDALIKKLDRQLENRGKDGRLPDIDFGQMVREGCWFGKNPLELFMIYAMKKHGIEDEFLYKKDGNGNLKLDEKGKPIPVFTNIDALDQFFGKVIGNPDSAREEYLFQQKVREIMAGRKDATTPANMSKDPLETMLKSILTDMKKYNTDWVARNYAATEILHGGKDAARYMASGNAAAYDVRTSGTFKTNMDYLRFEKPAYRREMGYAEYKSHDVEGLIFENRGWEAIFGFTVSHKWEGSSRGDNVLGLLDATRRAYNDDLKKYEKFYQGLVHGESIFYDKKFADDMKKRGILKTGEKGLAVFDVDAYDAIIDRGYRWGDMKNGVGLLLSVDRKSVPMVEFDQKYMTWQKGKDGKLLPIEQRDGIVRKGDVPNYAALVARTMGSFYTSREIGFVILKKDTYKDKDGNEKIRWIYTDPFKEKEAQAMAMGAEKRVAFRKEIIESMVKINEGSKPEDAGLRVVSTRDFNEYGRKKSDAFGEYTGLDRTREWIRSKYYGYAMRSAESSYGAFADRLDKMQEWYSAQYQLRQALDRFGGAISEEMMDGNKRWKTGNAALDRIDEMYAAKKIKSDDFKTQLDASDRNRLTNEMENLAKGKDVTYWEGKQAWWHEWRGRIASTVVKDIGEAENNYYNARLELRALDKLHARGEIADSKYDALRSEIQDKKNEMRREYREAKHDYGDLNRMLITWNGSHGSGPTYNPARTMWNMGIVSRLLDSHQVQGQKDVFYEITESSVMRDPRTAIGAGAPGMDWAWYVGYHTGQNVYERARFWATNSLWEQHMHLQLNIAYAVHKWWNDKISFMARYTTGYPAPVKSDMMYAPDHEHRGPTSYMKAPFIALFQAKTYTDFFKARLQDTVTFTGVGHMIAAHQATGGYDRGEEGRSWVRNQLDKMGMESHQYWDTPYQLSLQQRYIDQVREFDKFIEKNGGLDVDVNGEKIGLAEANRRLSEAAIEMDIAKEKTYTDALFKTLDNAANFNDKRGRYIRDVLSGRDIAEDGSRNRFLDMYIMFHTNVFTPTIPGMLQSAPIGSGEWHSFPQVARTVDNADEKSHLGTLKSYWEARYDQDTKEIYFTDRFQTRMDSVAENYKTDVPVMMHLMKMQSREVNYSSINNYTLAFMSPVWVPIIRGAYKNLAYLNPAMSSLSSTFEEPLLTRKVNRLINHAPKEHRQKPEEYEYPRDLYQSRWVSRFKAQNLVQMGERTSDYLSQFAPARWVIRKMKRAHYISSPGSRRISDNTREEYMELALITGNYGSDYDVY